MTTLGIALRWLHLAASIVLVGGVVMLLLAGPSDRPTARAWHARITRAARWLLLVAVLAGAGVIVHQTVVLEGRAAAAVDPQALVRVATHTQSGLTWVVRLAILLVAAIFLVARFRVVDRLDWIALHGETAGLALIALGLLGAGGHAAAVEPSPLRAIAVDFVHLGAAGIWAGALPALVLLLVTASRETGADARPYAVLAARRFSRCALVSVIVLTASGIGNARENIGDVAGLIGTTYGRLLMAKLMLFAAALVFAARSRRRLLPALGGDAATIGRPAMRRLASAVGIEAALILLVLGLVAALSVTPPARHEQPAWPFSFRLTTSVLEGAPDARVQAIVGSQVAVVGTVALLCGLLLPKRGLALVAGSLVLVLVGGVMALVPLAVDAYPTTYHRPTVPYGAGSIVAGAAVYGERCAACHGRAGAGDGPAATRLPRPPADLRAPHTGQHTAGDLFWWVSHGIPRGAMPGFASALTEEQRWDVINYVRLLGVVEQARWMGPRIDPGRAWLVAPDFTYAVTPAPPHSLREYRGRRHVLLVLYTLPASRERLAQLAESYQLLSTLGVEIVAVPTNASPQAIRELGDHPRVFFPIATEGAPEILEVYRRFDDAPHVEFLIDRQGYVRARWASRGPTARPVNLLLAEVQELNEEKATAPPADEHVH